MKKCPDCKKQLPKNARLCPACGAKFEKRSRVKSSLLIIAIFLGITAIGCAGGILLARLPSGGNGNGLKNLNDKAEAVIQNDLKIFSNGNISEITERVFGEEVEKTLANDSENGIIAELFANAEVSVCSVEESAITYTIIAPDISDFFRANVDELQTITTTGELRQALIKYSTTVAKKEYTVTLPYAISARAEIEISYDDPEFINAMTGGLLDAYADLYNQYLEG